MTNLKIPNDKILSQVDFSHRFADEEMPGQPNPIETIVWMADRALGVLPLLGCFLEHECDAPVYPREVAKRALQLNAAAVIFAHNHPSGMAEPSPADKQITTKLQQALATLDIRVLDHFIIGDHSFSFAENGLI